MCHKRGMKNLIVTMTNRIYSWLYVTQTCCTRYPGHDGDIETFQVMTSTLPLGTIASISLFVGV